MAARIRTILFDNDGTLSDSVPICQAATNAALEKAGYPAVSLDQVAAGMRSETVLRMMGHAQTDDRAVGESLAESYYRKARPLIRQTPLFAHVKDMARRLITAGFRLGVVSNNLSEVVRQVLIQHDLLPFFPVIIGEDNAEAAKPAPDGLLQACRALETHPSETIYVGDGPSDSIAARAAGIVSVGVLWNTHDTADIRTMGFDYLLPDPMSLIGLLDSFNRS